MNKTCAAVSVFGGDTERFSDKLKEACKGKKPLFICVGRSGFIYESVAPRVGTMLSALPLYVFGNEKQNVTNTNFMEVMRFIDKFYGKDYCRIVINSAIGTQETVGSIHLLDGGINSGVFGGFFGRGESAYSKQTTFEKLGNVGILAFCASWNENCRWHSYESAVRMRNRLAEVISQAVFCAFV